MDTRNKALAPVTTVPTGKVKLHQVRVNGNPARAARRVRAAAIADQHQGETQGWHAVEQSETHGRGVGRRQRLGGRRGRAGSRR